MKVGYIRVSTITQNPERQLNEIKLDKVFIDKASGKTLDRPQFQNMMEFLREGDHLFIHSLDRLSRNLLHIRKTVDELIKKRVTVEFLRENLKFTGDDSPMAICVLSLLGACAELILGGIRKDQQEGIERAKKRGVYKGRKKALSEEQIEEIKTCYLLKKESKSSIARKYNVTYMTINNYFKKLNIRQT